jgi:chromate transporter
MYEVFWTALKLGLTSFGGPIAHLGYFERTYVRKLQWLSSGDYAGIVALCQALPGPTSSQVGFLVGLRKAGWGGALAAWVAFTLPSALLMYAFAVLAPRADGGLMRGVLHGLMLTAVAVVAQAVWSMARALCPDRERAGIAFLSGAMVLWLASPMTQLAVMFFGAVCGWLLLRKAVPAEAGGAVAVAGTAMTIAGGANGAATSKYYRAGVGAVLLYGALLVVLPLLAVLAPHTLVALAAIFYRAGALVFGGGHVVLPLLQQELVPVGWVSDSAFLAGYGLAQGMPGPLFTVAAFLGAASAPAGFSALWATVALIAIFMPGLLLATGGLSLWSSLMRLRGAPAVLAGINASVVGILAAALYDPVWRGGVHDLLDVVVAIAAFALLQLWRVPAPAIVALCVMVSLATRLRFL